MNSKDFDHWQQMDPERRRRALNLSKSFWIVGSLLALCGFVVSVIGLLVALTVGIWWVLWGGICMIGLGLPIFIIGLVSATGIASFEANEAFHRSRGGA